MQGRPWRGYLVLLAARDLFTCQALESDDRHSALSATCDRYGGSCPVAMIQKKKYPRTARVSDSIAEEGFFLAFRPAAKDHSVAFNGESHTVIAAGSTVELNQEGYKQVTSTNSKHEMVNFVRRVVEDLRLKIMREDAMRDFIAAQDKRVDYQSYDELLDEIKTEADRACGWVMNKNVKRPFSGKDAPLTEEGYRSIVALQNNSEMAHYVARAVKDQGYYVVSRDGMNGFVPFHSCEKASSSLEQMLSDIRGIAGNAEGWASVAAPGIRQRSDGSMNSSASFVSSSREVRDWALQAGVGRSAPLTEAGYQQTAALKNNVEMGIFVLRTIRHMSLEVADQDRFHGMIPFYSGERERQTFTKLQQEIRTVSQDACAWIVERGSQDNDGEEITGRNAPLTEEGYHALARQRDASGMRIFVDRVLREMKMHITDEAGLLGFLPYFDCEKGAKSLADLRTEISSSADLANSWVALGPSQHISLEGSRGDDVFENEESHGVEDSTSVSLQGEKFQF